MNEKFKNRYWDNLWGLLIFFAVIGGFMWGYYDSDFYIKNAVNMIYVFLAPAAAFMAGRAARVDEWRRSEQLKKYCVAYVVFNALMLAVRFLVAGEAVSFLTPAYSFWFLIAIVVWGFVAHYLDRVKFVIPVLFAVSLLIGFWPEIDGTLAIVQIASYFPFFMIGYKLSADIEEKLSAQKSPWLCAVGIVGFAGCCGAVYILGRYVELDANQLMRYAYDGYRVLAVRAVFSVIALAMIAFLLLAAPRRGVFALSKLGKNAYSVFVAYKFFVLLFCAAVPAGSFAWLFYIMLAAAAAVVLVVFGLDPVAGAIKAALDFCISIFSQNNKKKIVVVMRAAIALVLVCVLAIPLGTKLLEYVSSDPSETAANYIAPVLSGSDLSDSDVVIAYIGDMILLQDQVRAAYSDETGEYDFTDVFKYAAPYLSSAEYAVGVLEGPLAGSEAGYSSSNFDDAIPMYLNFPDSFAAAARDAGIDLVTSATNHILDKGTDGVVSTINALDKLGIAHVGIFDSNTDKRSNAVQIVEVAGLEIAFVGYTYGTNYYTDDEVNGSVSYVSSFLAAPTSMHFSACKRAVQDDLLYAQNQNPDCIIVMAHMGEQFSHETSNYQDVWNDIFIDAGADIVLGDHSHAVQPIEFADGGVIVNCPGNFANLYTADDGDASAIVELHLDANSGAVKAVSVVPMWTTSSVGGQYQAIPISTLLTDETLFSSLSVSELDRITEVQSTITSVMLGKDISLAELQDRYYLIGGEYRRQNVAALEYADEDGNGFMELLGSVDSVCFIGDSITAGTMNHGYGWYEPLAAMFPSLDVTRCAWGSATTETLLAKKAEISAVSSDLYVIAIGTNDVRYRNENCALTPAEYVANLEALADGIKSANPNAQFAFVTPWISMVDDPNREQSQADCRASHYEYGDALEVFCADNGFAFLDPQPYLEFVLETYVTGDYLVDYIHPNAGEGIRLYSYAVLSSAKTEAVA